jgi:membrane-associated phospholipid phosphatase
MWLTKDRSSRAIVPAATISARGLWRDAAIHFARLTLFLAALVLLVAVRSDVPLYVYAVAAVVSLAAIYITVREGSDLRVWAVYILAFLLFAHLRTFADEIGTPTRFGYVIDLEKALFMGTVPTLWLQEHFYVLGKARVLEIYSMSIYLTYFFAPHLVALVLWLLNSSRFRLYVVAILGTFYLSLAVSYLVPTAPPWLAGQTGDLPHVFRILRDIMNQVSPGAYQRGYEIAGSNDVAAMPSLHMAITFIIVFIAWRFHAVAGVVALLYAASMGFALVYLGEHYVVDLLAGLLAAIVVWKLAAWWWRRRNQDQREGPLESPVTGEAALEGFDPGLADVQPIER